MVDTELSKIVGAKNVIDHETSLEEYSQDMSFVPRVRPKCVVKVTSADAVTEIIKWANATKTPLVPISSGGPHFRGDTVPSAGGAVIVDLSGLNRVMRADRRNRVAMIEPGVTFGELIPALAKEGMRLNLPLLPRANKSVVGSMLEREPVIMPLYQWDIIDPLSCIEVVFGTGDKFRTGSAAGPGSLEDQWNAKQAQVNPSGPGQTDFARVVQGSQGTMGIVTWTTVRCEQMPSIQKPLLAGSEKLASLTELVYQMMWLKVVDECLIVNGSDLASMLTKKGEEYETIRGGLPPWLLFFTIGGYDYFPEDKIAYQEKEIRDAAKRLGLNPASSVGGVSAYEVLRTLSKPSDEPYWKLRYKDGCQDIFFLTTLDKISKFIDVMNEVAGRCSFPSSDIGVYVQPMVQGTCCHVEFDLFYDPKNKKEAGKVQKLCNLAKDALVNAGGFFNRPYGSWADVVYLRDGETAAALRKVKQIFDPNNIMNAGKLCF